ncbi:MAG: hypothetical protein ABJA32_08730 [Ginsengibacter sp.]
MIKSNFKIAFRNEKRNKSYALINTSSELCNYRMNDGRVPGPKNGDCEAC